MEMDMLISNIPGINSKAFPLGNLLELSLQLLFNVGACQYLAAILRRPNDVIAAMVRTVFQLVELMASGQIESPPFLRR